MVDYAADCAEAVLARLGASGAVVSLCLDLIGFDIADIERAQPVLALAFLLKMQ
jgi:hypothetical protein